MTEKEFTQKEINKINERELKEAEETFNDFLLNFNQGKCFECKGKLESFDKDIPCFHWLLSPAGAKKKYFGLIFKKYGLFQLLSYLRWVANADIPFRNINDLKIESRSSRVLETTIKYKNKEWTFCINKTDLEGHDRFNFPHYHFNMKIDNKRFIEFHDSHIKLNQEDLFNLNALLGNIPKMNYVWGRGAGMQDLMNLPADTLINSGKTADDESQDTIHMSSFIEAKPGEKIKGSDIQDIIKESRRTGRTITALARERLKDHTIQTIISPGEAVPKLNERHSRRHKGESEEPKP